MILRSQSPAGCQHWLEDLFDDLSLRTRRLIAAMMALAILAGAMLASALGQADFERSGQLVRTE